MEREIIRNRVKGALVGCAYGDALGMPTEMMCRNYIEELFPEGVHEFSASTKYDFIGRAMKAGEITDDTINTLLIVDMLIQEKGVVHTMSYLTHLQNWIKDNPEKNKYVAGPSTLRALDAIAKGTAIEKAGIFGTTNGSSMKISPIGIVSDYHEMSSLVDNVEKICLPTHNTSIAIAGASAIAACISYAIHEEKPIIDQLWQIAVEAATLGEQRGFAFPSASLVRRMQAVREMVDSCSKEAAIHELQSFYGTGAETIETVPAVLAIVILSKGNPLEAAQISAAIGGDTDTIGAISCSICGCFHPDFPQEAIATLEEVNDISFEKLVEELLPYAVL